MATNKSFKGKPSEALKGGKSGGMHKFEGAGPQKPGVSGVSKSSTKGKFAEGGPSGKMHKFKGVGSQKPGVSSVESGGGKKGSYAKS